jgi:hypothetical protein
MVKANLAPSGRPCRIALSGKPDHGGGDRPAEDDDDGVLADEHMQIAAHQHHHRHDSDAGGEADARHDIHGKLQRVRERPPVLDGAAAQPKPRMTTLRWRH